MVKHIIKKALGMIPRLLWWMINGTAAAALSSHFVLASRRPPAYRTFHRSGIASLANREDKSRTGSHPAGSRPESQKQKRISSDIRFSGGRSGARMRLYPDPLSALSVEKKGDDAVHRVSFFRSVTISVTQIYAMTVSCCNL